MVVDICDAKARWDKRSSDEGYVEEDHSVSSSQRVTPPQQNVPASSRLLCDHFLGGERFSNDRFAEAIARILGPCNSTEL